MPVLQIKRGLRANIPSTAANGELILTTDDQFLSVGNVAGNAVVPIKIAVANVVGLSTPVSTVFGRSGAVVAAANDYSFSQLSGSAVAGQIPVLDASKITTGTLSAALLPTIDGGVF
jgi:hypothetical protein